MGHNQCRMASRNGLIQIICCKSQHQHRQNSFDPHRISTIRQHGNSAAKPRGARWARVRVSFSSRPLRSQHTRSHADARASPPPVRCVAMRCSRHVVNICVDRTACSISGAHDKYRFVVVVGAGGGGSGDVAVRAEIESHMFSRQPTTQIYN